MKNYRLIVLSKPVQGQEEAFNTWYTNTHIKDLMKVPGVKTAQRFKVRTDLSKNVAIEYVAEYEIESADITATIGEIRGRLGTDAMPMSDAFDRTTSSFIVIEPLAGVIPSENGKAGADDVQTAVSFVFSSPVAGQEDAYQAWYDKPHVTDLLRVPGYRQGQRFRVIPELSRNIAQAYVARYDIQTPDIPTTMATARSRLGTEAMVMSPAFDMATASFMLTQPVTDKLAA